MWLNTACQSKLLTAHNYYSCQSGHSMHIISLKQVRLISQWSSLLTCKDTFQWWLLSIPRFRWQQCWGHLLWPDQFWQRWANWVIWSWWCRDHGQYSSTIRESSGWWWWWWCIDCFRSTSYLQLSRNVPHWYSASGVDIQKSDILENLYKLHKCVLKDQMVKKLEKLKQISILSFFPKL